MKLTPAGISIWLVVCILPLIAEAASGPVLRPMQPVALNSPSPPLIGMEESWLNTDGKKLQFEKGRVYVVGFWTYGCINCKRNLPAYARWQKQFADQKLTIIGIHTPETDPERNVKNVREQVEKLGITYPVLLDQKAENWKAWQQEVWPTVYLIDQRGYIRYRWTGELEWQNAGGEAKMKRYIEYLLAQP